MGYIYLYLLYIDRLYKYAMDHNQFQSRLFREMPEIPLMHHFSEGLNPGTLVCIECRIRLSMTNLGFLRFHQV